MVQQAISEACKSTKIYSKTIRSRIQYIYKLTTYLLINTTYSPELHELYFHATDSVGSHFEDYSFTNVRVMYYATILRWL